MVPGLLEGLDVPRIVGRRERPTRTRPARRSTSTDQGTHSIGVGCSPRVASCQIGPAVRAHLDPGDPAPTGPCPTGELDLTGVDDPRPGEELREAGWDDRASAGRSGSRRSLRRPPGRVCGTRASGSPRTDPERPRSGSATSRSSCRTSRARAAGAGRRVAGAAAGRSSAHTSITSGCIASSTERLRW